MNIGQDNPVKIIDVFVDELNLAELGFNGARPANLGQWLTFNANIGGDMSIQYDFPDRGTIRIVCGEDVIEVPLPGSVPADGGTGDADGASPTVSAIPAASPAPPAPVPRPGTGGVVATGGIPPGRRKPPPQSARPKTIPRAMGFISKKAVDFNWTQLASPVDMVSLDELADATEDKLSRATSIIENLKILNVGVPGSAKPKQLKILPSILRNRPLGVDAVRLFRLADQN